MGLVSKHSNGVGRDGHSMAAARFTIRLVQVGVRATILIAGMLSAVPADAVGLGTLHLSSALGQPLRVEVRLVSALDSDLDQRCYKGKVTSLDGATLGRATIDINLDGPAPLLVVTTGQSINEPALTLSLEYTCASQTRRDYQILLDLMPVTPAVIETPRTAATQVAVEKRAPEAAQLSVGAAIAATQPVAKKPTRRHSLGTEIKSNDEYAQIKPAAASESKEMRRGKSSTKAFRSVLRLGTNNSVDNDLNDNVGMHLALSHSLYGSSSETEAQPPAQAQVHNQAQAQTQAVAPVATPAATQAAVPIAANAGNTTAPSPSAAANVDLNAHPNDIGLQELQAKIRVLEAETDELRKLNAKHLAALEGAQTIKPPGTPLLYLYFMLLASFVAIVWLVWRTRQIQSDINHSSWNQIVPEPDQVGEFADVAEAGEDDRFLEQDERAPEASNVPQPKPAQRIASAEVAEPPAAVAPVQLSPVAAPTEEHQEGDYKFTANVRSALPNAEEILDEIQQAEFWMDMQQPQRAIEILESNWGGERPSSPLPWLYLFDLYRMVGDEQKYLDLTERFQHIFNGKVIPWGDGGMSEHSRSLEEFPILMKKIVQMWPSEELVPFLENLLIDDRDGRRQGFDLAAYRDILFLANIAYEVQDLNSAAKAPQNDLEWSVTQ